MTTNISNVTEWNNWDPSLTDANLTANITFTSQPTSKIISGGHTLDAGGYSLIFSNISGLNGFITVREESTVNNLIIELSGTTDMAIFGSLLIGGILVGTFNNLKILGFNQTLYAFALIQTIIGGSNAIFNNLQVGTPSDPVIVIGDGYSGYQGFLIGTINVDSNVTFNNMALYWGNNSSLSTQGYLSPIYACHNNNNTSSSFVVTFNKCVSYFIYTGATTFQYVCFFMNTSRAVFNDCYGYSTNSSIPCVMIERVTLFANFPEVYENMFNRCFTNNPTGFFKEVYLSTGSTTSFNVNYCANVSDGWTSTGTGEEYVNSVNSVLNYNLSGNTTQAPFNDSVYSTSWYNYNDSGTIGAPILKVYTESPFNPDTYIFYNDLPQFADPLPCVLEGTCIRISETETKKVEDLKIGETILVFDRVSEKNVNVPIINIFKREIPLKYFKDYPYKIPRNYFGVNIPDKNTHLSEFHAFYSTITSHPKCCKFFEQDFSLEKVRYYHIEIENFFDQLMYANNLLVETFDGKRKGEYAWSCSPEGCEMHILKEL